MVMLLMQLDSALPPPPRPNKKRRLIDIVGLSLALVALTVAALRFVPAFRLTLLVALGRSPICPLGMALKAEDMIREHLSRMEGIVRASRVVEKDKNGLHLWETPKGRFWMPHGNAQLLASLLVEQEHGIYSLGQKGVRAGDIALDCGAHVGVYTREALAAGAKLVVAIEPSPVNLAALRRNLAHEIAAGRVIVYEKGVWDIETVLDFHVDAENSAASSVLLPHENNPHMIKVSLTTIDKLVAELQLERVDFIKMDIEGAEQKALAGARETLTRFKPRVAAASYHVPEDQTRIPQLARAARPDYAMVCGPCGEKDYRIIPHTLLFH